jgi:hypothetical protein
MSAHRPYSKEYRRHKRVTVAMTVTASGKVLLTMLVFKGSYKGRIVKEELPTLTPSMFYACQANAWMDERAMLQWVEWVLKPYVETAPDGIIPMLFLDSYRCHMMSSVVDRVNELGVEVRIIPGGCTPLVQPVDIGINRPLKCKLRELWECWMVEVGLRQGRTQPPKRRQIALWVEEALEVLHPQLVRNSWRHGKYSFFPLTCRNIIQDEIPRQLATTGSSSSSDDDSGGGHNTDMDAWAISSGEDDFGWGEVASSQEN